MDRGCHRESMARRAATALPRAWRGRREQPRDVGLEQVLLKLGATGAFRWQNAPFNDPFVAIDPCGAVFTASGLTIVKLAP
jgi:hypothetical protein